MRYYWLITLLCTTSLLHGQQIDLQFVGDGFDVPVDIANAGTADLYIVEKPGRIQLMPDGTLSGRRTFLNIQDRVLDNGGEQGLLGLVFHPDYESNGYFYVNYTTGAGAGTTRISRFSRSVDDSTLADADSERILLEIEQPFANHNAGDLAFGPDGYLYIALGDGGSGGDPQDLGQNRQRLLGKMLRIDVDQGETYVIPPDNPFAMTEETLDEIWAIGLRNPFRFSFDRQTGDLWVADVGQNAFEEINRQPAASAGGENYGWRCYEGNAAFDESGNCPEASVLTFPVFDYAHEGPNCGGSVTGGFVYRGTANPTLQGLYIFADFCLSEIYALRQNGNEEYERILLSEAGPGNWITFGEDQEGELLISSASGGVYRIVADQTTSLPGTFQPEAWQVSPNPVRGVLSITLAKAPTGVVQASIYGLQGEVLHQFSWPAHQLERSVDVSRLPAGLYTLQLQRGSEVATKRFVVD